MNGIVIQWQVHLIFSGFCVLTPASTTSFFTGFVFFIDNGSAAIVFKPSDPKGIDDFMVGMRLLPFYKEHGDLISCDTVMVDSTFSTNPLNTAIGGLPQKDGIPYALSGTRVFHHRKKSSMIQCGDSSIVC
jgi:hypothetical protein